MCLKSAPTTWYITLVMFLSIEHWYMQSGTHEWYFEYTWAVHVSRLTEVAYEIVMYSKRAKYIIHECHHVAVTLTRTHKWYFRYSWTPHYTINAKHTQYIVHPVCFIQNQRIFHLVRIIHYFADDGKCYMCFESRLMVTLWRCLQMVRIPT